MSKQEYNDWYVYHLIQPSFFNHYHLSKRKVEALRYSGLNAHLLSFVNKAVYASNKQKLNEIKADGFLKLIITSNRKTALSPLLFFLSEIMKGKKLIIHALKVDTTLLCVIKHIPYLNKRLTIIQEFEGDKSSEFVYSVEYSEGSTPLENPKKIINKIKNNYFLLINKIKINCSDALILMSEEHKALINARSNQNNSVLILPTLPESERIFYDPEARKEIREKFNYNEKIVLIYTGNISCSWQRLEPMCKIVQQLSSRNMDIAFLLLVSPSDISIAQAAVEKYNIEKITIVDNILAEEVYKYLSAADIGLYLRHNHQMNNIVTSGKLGEYLAAGLPVISTGANASVLNKFMIENNLIIEINDNLTLTDKFIEVLDNKDRFLKSKRNYIQSIFYESFNMDEKLKIEYPEFIKNLMW